MSDPSKRIQDLSVLHPVVREKVERVQRQLDTEGIPLRVFESYRTPDRQKHLYSQGRTRPGRIVTKAQPWTSYHQYGLAVDFVFFESGEWHWGKNSQHSRWYDRLHEIARATGLEPLSWETPHLQLIGWTMQRLRQGDFPAGGDATWAENLRAHAEAWNGSPSAPPLGELGELEPERPPLDLIGDSQATPQSLDLSPIPDAAEKRLKSRLFGGNAALEAVASGHRVLRASGGQIEGVGLLQDALNLLAVKDAAYAIATGAFRGYFGQKTQFAVKAFQEDYQLVIDGEVGEETIVALDEALSVFEQSPTAHHSGTPVFAVAGAGYVPLAINTALLARVKFQQGDAAPGSALMAAYATADRTPSAAKGDPSNCKALLKFPDGTVFFDAKMAICADGSPRALAIDPGPGNPKTAFTYPGSPNGWFNAENVPYIVLPGKNPSGSLNFNAAMGISKLDLAVVIHKGKITPAFYGEVGPWFRLGEAAIRVHESLPVRTPWTSSGKVRIRNASVEGDVLCFVFPNTAVKKSAGMSDSEWLASTLETAMKCWENFLATQ